MEALKVLIVEDEMIIAESISDMLSELGYEVMGICIRAKQALEFIRKNPPDVALFDIQLKGEEDGIWLANQIKEIHSFPFVFLTSYGDKATIDKAVNTSPYGYLIKPVEKQNLYGTIEVALKRFGEILNQNENEGFVIRNYFFVKENYQYVKINVQEIDFIKSDDNYLEIMVGTKKHLIRSTLKDFVKQLPADTFQRIHRSYAVNTEKVSSFSSTSVSLGEHSLPISKKFFEELSTHFKTLS
ncbi:LytR/AlgR family response regulator transcription factor [Marinoscillum furvescens]|uniref:LytTR family two component transcriptional regulator n=1 Tax=Marinoscillum furvescens DSM 4134 TaxID=1122208 RepID=A0A3D9LJC5_MARFU|nr:LytTR family transcriptional regulator DNA-binding domain-containing protein [Marinoscillum furvescens]REE05756.1 LytTR family two component transcriptional regulator [Marinoscillum furvescens DSM 4134]